MQVEDLPGVGIEPLPGFGEGNPSGPAIEQRDMKLFFEHGDSLADGRLSDAQIGRSGGKATPLRDRGEGRQVRKLRKARSRRKLTHRSRRPEMTRHKNPPIIAKSAAIVTAELPCPTNSATTTSGRRRCHFYSRLQQFVEVLFIQRSLHASRG